MPDPDPREELTSVAAEAIANLPEDARLYLVGLIDITLGDLLDRYDDPPPPPPHIQFIVDEWRALRTLMGGDVDEDDAA